MNFRFVCFVWFVWVGVFPLNSNSALHIIEHKALQNTKLYIRNGLSPENNTEEQTNNNNFVLILFTINLIHKSEFPQCLFYLVFFFVHHSKINRVLNFYWIRIHFVSFEDCLLILVWRSVYMWCAWQTFGVCRGFLSAHGQQLKGTAVLERWYYMRSVRHSWAFLEHLSVCIRTRAVDNTN